MPKRVAEGVWIVDSGPLRVLGLPVPVRMTVFRLRSGDLLLHSPTRYDAALRDELERLGRVRHLVAPNSAHWTFLRDWQQACPEAVTWAAPGLRDRAQVRRSGVRLDHDLGEAPPAEWAGEVAQAIVPGGVGFREVALLHRETRTLVLTDLVLNLEPDKLPLVVRPLARLIGVTAPQGRAPVYLRLVVRMRRREAAAAAAVTAVLQERLRAARAASDGLLLQVIGFAEQPEHQADGTLDYAEVARLGAMTEAVARARFAAVDEPLVSGEPAELTTAAPSPGSVPR